MEVTTYYAGNLFEKQFNTTVNRLGDGELASGDCADTTNGVTDYGFTGQRNETSFGLMDFNARYYSPRLGRFISPDSMVPDPTTAKGFNRYLYADGNPIKFSDPSGHCVTNDQEVTRGDAFDCTVDEMSSLTWETRTWWTEKFMSEKRVDWFHNVLGILDYFAADAQFSDLDGWASQADAGVLVAIQDGWRESNELTAIDNRPEALAASTQWAKFFDLRATQGDEDPAVRSQWGIAEQAGVDFGVTIAAPYAVSVDAATNIQIDTFVGFGNVYRSMIKEEIWNWWLVGDMVDAYIDPRTEQSRSFVRGFSNHVISPASAGLWGLYESASAPWQ